MPNWGAPSCVNTFARLIEQKTTNKQVLSFVFNGNRSYVLICSLLQSLATAQFYNGKFVAKRHEQTFPAKLHSQTAVGFDLEFLVVFPTDGAFKSAATGLICLFNMMS